MEIVKVILTYILSATALFIIAKVMGHKQMAQLDFFDYITGITIGSIAAELATELEKPWKPLIAMIIYGGVSVCLTIIARKSFKLSEFINGTLTIVMNNSKIYRENMKKAKLDLNEFMVLCRQEGYFNINDIQTAIFEYNGRLTILPLSDKRPLSAADVNLELPKEKICTEIIMDGRVLKENLDKLGLDINWLDKQLKQQKYKNAKEIYLGICDQDNKLSLFPMKQ